jgi:hypothetical protein
MNYADLLMTVKERLPSRRAISVDYIWSRYRVLRTVARKVIDDLQREELIGRDWNTEFGGYPVLVKEVENA